MTLYFVSWSFVKAQKSGCTFGGFGSRLTVAEVFFMAMQYSFSSRMRCMCPNLPPVLSLSTAAAIWHNSTVKFLTVRMVGYLLIQGRSYPSRVALTAKAICVLALVLDIVGCSNYLQFKLNAEIAILIGN